MFKNFFFLIRIIRKFSSAKLMFFNKKDYWSYFEEGESKYDSDDYEGAI